MRGSATTYWPSSIRLPLRWPTATTLFAGGRCVLETLRSGFAFIAAFTTSICAEVFGIQGRSAVQQSHFHTLMPKSSTILLMIVLIFTLPPPGIQLAAQLLAQSFAPSYTAPSEGRNRLATP